MTNIVMEISLLLICLLGLAVSDNSTIGERSMVDDVSEMSNVENDLQVDAVDQSVTRGDWSPWSKWSACSRSCGGGIARQQRRCRRKSCKGKSWNTKYKICNNQSCDKPSDFRAEQCTAFNEVPYSGQLLKWYPHYDPSRPCSLICRGEPSPAEAQSGLRQSREALTARKRSARNSLDDDEDNDTDGEDLAIDADRDGDEPIVVLLAEKVEDGTRCYPDSSDICIAGECMKVGCDLRVGSNKNTDACGVCGGNGSTCQSRYSWSLESISACTKSCGGGFKIAMAICKAADHEESAVEESYCNPASKPDKTLMPCNTHPCTTKWITGEWSKCSTTCGGGSRTRAVFCIEENGNETTKLPEYRCNAMHRPRYQETCSTISCPMWETSQWTECSVSCGTGIRTRKIECRDGNGRISTDCDPAEKPRTEQECKTNVGCTMYDESLAQPLIQAYPPPPVAEKLIDQPMPSESTFISEEWSPCSVTCGEGVRRREVHCKIFLEFSRTVAKLPDTECSGPKPVETEKCLMEPCSLMENNLSYRIDTVGDDSYAESNLMDSYKPSSGISGSLASFEGGIKVAPGSDVQTTFSWKEDGYTPCSASCLGGVQDLIISCIRDDTGKAVTPLLCTAETKPEARIRTCNDQPCPPRWNYSEFSPCPSPCGIGIQTRDVTCIHEVARGPGNTVTLPNSMCPKPPPADRRYCNIWDCPVEWSVEEWGKCSKTCGGGVKRRKVSCEQVMAQGRKQSREDRECVSQRPPSEKPCNTRACPEVDANAQPIILGHNGTYNQTDLNAKVDLKIGGIARVFQGTAFIKIRCPVKKFDKAQIVWMKDHRKLQRSNKYKISRKGALKIIDITASDAGIYACVAGQSRAETHLLVKFRTKEQISSEEYLRLGNSVQRTVNLDSAPANSGENLYPDRAAAYGNRFVPIDSEDLSHERGAPSKPTRKPHQKKQRTSPSPTDVTVDDREHVVTSLHQPGHHESVESTASSGASMLVPHLTYLISSLKNYWPFQSDGASTKTGAASLKETRKERTAPRNSMPNRHTDTKYQDVQDDFTHLYNTAIPDNTFGPDEERIFIDVDPYELDDGLFDLRHSEAADFTPEFPATTRFEADYEEESLRNAKRQSQDPSDLSSRSHRGVFKIQDTTTVRHHHGLLVEENSKEDTHGPKDHRQQDLNHLREIADKQDSTSREENSTGDSNGEGLSLRQLSIAVFSTVSSKDSEIPVKSDNTANEGIYFEPLNNTDRATESVPEERNYTTNNETGDMERKRFVDLENKSKEHTKNESRQEFPTDDKNEDDVESKGSTKEMHTQKNASISYFDTSENIVFEWVTTEWSKCSQTCGGSGFQIRGAQCTVRPMRAAVNTTRKSFGPGRTVVEGRLCEEAGHPVPQKVKSCGFGQCPEWHTTEWTPCETSRCFNWKTAMQRRDVSCRLAPIFHGEQDENQQNVTLLDLSQCDNATRPPQRQECYNDECKGVWRVGEWSECTGVCEENGIKYRILQCVWFGTKKPAGNACRDIPRPPVMKTCRGPPCLLSPEECKDQSQLCRRVKMMNMCKVPLYRKQCCKTCR